MVCDCHLSSIRKQYRATNTQTENENILSVGLFRAGCSQHSPITVCKRRQRMFDTPMLHVYVMEQTHLFPFDFCNLLYGLVAHINCLLGQNSKYFSGLKYISHKSTSVLLMVVLDC